MERYERPLRMSAAQIDNDVLRQTLLGGQVPIYESAKGKDIVERRASLPGEGGATTQIDYGGQIVKTGPDAGKVIVADAEPALWVQKFREINALAQSDSTMNQASDRLAALAKDQEFIDSIPDDVLKAFKTNFYDSHPESIRKQHYERWGELGGDQEAVGILSAVVQGITDLNRFKKTSVFDTMLDQHGRPEPIYKKKEDGTDFIVPKDEETGEFILEAGPNQEIPSGGVAAPAGELTGYTRAGTGLVDMLGDSRNVQEFTTRQATESDVAAGLASEVGESITEASGNRQSGFDADGNFLGLAALAEDIQRGNLSRQREADLADVERLSDRYSTLMDEYKPGTQEALGNASEVLNAQKDSLTGAGAIELPIDSIYGGDLDATTMQAAQVADPLKLSSRTAFGGEAGLAQVLNNDVDQGGRRVAHFEDSLRSQLLGDAKQALGQGLTDRETRAIQDSARARSTMMGRTFDPAGAIAESEARVLEDNNRRMQNRAFAQSVLGQEAGLQQGDLTRGMAQESEQAGMQQQNNLAQAQLDQQANAFDADSAMRAATINQGQKQQANQFEVGATMDAQRLNEQLKQSGTLGYIDAATRLAAMEDQYTLDPFQAILGRASGGSLQAGQGVFGQAGYGLQSGPQYLNPESGLGYISQMAANQANMYAANTAANATRDAGMMGMFGNIIGGVAGGAGAAIGCWVAREVYGETNPSWMLFREWLIDDSPSWFRNLYIKYGERFAQWISDKPRIKSIIRKWMDSKIGGK
jgi:hypothetical protein